MEEHSVPPIRYDRPHQRDQQQPATQPISPPELYDLQQGPYSPNYNSLFHGTYFDSRPTQQGAAQQPHERYYDNQDAPAEVLGDTTRAYELPTGAYQGYQYDNPEQQTAYQGYVPQPLSESFKPGQKFPKPHRSPHFYMPPILRLPSLLIVFLISAGLVGVVQYGIMKLPHTDRSHLDTLLSQKTSSALGKRAESASATPNMVNTPVNSPVTTPAHTPVTTPVTTPISTPVSTPVNTPVNSPAPAGANSPGGQQTVQETKTTIGGAYVPTTVSVQAAPAAQPTHSEIPQYKPQSSYVPTDVTTPSTTQAPVANTSQYVPTTVVLQATPAVSATPPAIPEYKPQSSYVPTDPAGQTTTFGLVPNTSQYVPTSVNPAVGQPTGTTIGGAYVPTIVTPAVGQTSTTIGGAYVPTTVTNPSGHNTPNIVVDTSSYVPTVVPTAAPGTYVPTAITGSYVPTAITGSYVPTAIPTGTGGSYVPTVVPSAASGTYVPTDLSGNNGQSASGVSNGITGTAVAQGENPSGTNTMGTLLGYTPVPITTMVTISGTYVTSVASVIVTTDAQGHATSYTTFVPTTTVGTQAVETTIIITDTKGLFPIWKVFVGNNYMILVFAILFRQIWVAIYTQAKLIEPFTHLEDPRGVSARQVLDSFYLSSTFTPDPIVAIARRHWFVLWTSVVYLTVGFLGPIGSEALFLDSYYPNCPLIAPNNNVNYCWPPRLSIDPVLARGLQAMLVYVAVMTLTLMVMVWRMRSGVYSDPSAIASVASLVHHPEVLEDFRSFSPEASMKEIMHVIGHKWYKLDEYQRPDGTWRYGLVPAAPGQLNHEEVPYEDLKAPKPRFRRWKTLDAIADSVFLVVLLGLLAVVVVYFKDDKVDGFNNFFTSAKFGPRFLLTSIGTAIAINWRRLERDVHTLSVYHRMAETAADARSTILLRKSSIPLTSIFPMLFKRHFFASYMALISVLSETLVIFLGALPFAAGQVFMELLVSSYASMAILGLMILSVIALMIWKRRLPDLPRAPDTVAAVVSYVSDAKMLEDFEGCEYADDRELVQRIAGSGKRYVYGKMPGTDGVSRYLVDEESSSVYHS